MIKCRNCGKELSELTAGLHYCHDMKPVLDHYCDDCGELKTVCICGIVEERSEV